MKAIVLAVALVLVMPSTLLAQSGDMKGMAMGDHKGMDMKDHKGMEGMKSAKKGEGQVHKAMGRITKIDRSAGAVTIAHDPVPSMRWPSMTMAFKVKDKAMLEKLKSDAKVDFSFTQSGKDYVITDIK